MEKELEFLLLLNSGDKKLIETHLSNLDFVKFIVKFEADYQIEKTQCIIDGFKNFRKKRDQKKFKTIYKIKKSTKKITT